MKRTEAHGHSGRAIRSQSTLLRCAHQDLREILHRWVALLLSLTQGRVCALSEVGSLQRLHCQWLVLFQDVCKLFQIKCFAFHDLNCPINSSVCAIQYVMCNPFTPYVIYLHVLFIFYILFDYLVFILHVYPIVGLIQDHLYIKILI